MAKIYAVLGNHDPGASDERFCRFLNDAHIRLLYNKAAELPTVNLIGRVGIVDMQELRRSLGYIMQKTNPKKRSIVLDHDPQGIWVAVACGADLVLCGHIHKGQFFPMDILTRLANGREYFYGYGRKGKTQFVICAGTGFFQLPIRVGINSETVVLDIAGSEGQ